MTQEARSAATSSGPCELGGCKFLPLCESCEQAEIIAATRHLSDPSVYSPLAARWGLAGQFPPPEIEAYIEQVLADVSGGSSSSLTPGAGDATQGAKDAAPGTVTDSPPPKMTSDRAQAIECWQEVERKEERIEELSRLLLDVEGSLLAYWTDIPESEIQRLLPLIRGVLGDYEPA